MHIIFHWIYMTLYLQQNQISLQLRTNYHLIYTIFHWIFMIWYIHWFSIEFSWLCTFNEFEFFYKSEWSVHLMYTIFHWIFTILYFQWKQKFLQVRAICTSNVHNFPLNFHDLVHSSIFHRILSNSYIKQIQIFLLIQMTYCLMYRIFHWIFRILYIQWIQIFKQIHMICTFSIHNFSSSFHDLERSSIFHWVFMILYIQLFQIVHQIWMIVT